MWGLFIEWVVPWFSREGSERLGGMHRKEQALEAGDSWEMGS